MVTHHIKYAKSNKKRKTKRQTATPQTKTMNKSVEKEQMRFDEEVSHHFHVDLKVFVYLDLTRSLSPCRCRLPTATWGTSGFTPCSGRWAFCLSLTINSSVWLQRSSLPDSFRKRFLLLLLSLSPIWPVKPADSWSRHRRFLCCGFIIHVCPEV